MHQNTSDDQAPRGPVLWQQRSLDSCSWIEGDVHEERDGVKRKGVKEKKQRKDEKEGKLEFTPHC